MVDNKDGREPKHDLADRGHHTLVCDDEGAIAEAEHRAPRLRSDEHRLGPLGQRVNRRSPFYIGMTASAGVALTYGAVRVLGSMSSALVLIGVALFFASGLEPAVSWLVNRKLPSWAAVTVVVAVVFTLVAGTLSAAERGHQLPRRWHRLARRVGLDGEKGPNAVKSLDSAP